MDLLARAIPTDPATYRPDLSVDLIAALRMAWEQDVPFVNVVGLLGATGYEVRIIPAEPTDDLEQQFMSMTGLGFDQSEEEGDEEGEDEAGPVEALVAELAARLGVTKGISFEVENRVIARNRKRKAAQEPHPFRRARWTTRGGVARCLTCGMSQPGDAAACPGLGYAKAAVDKMIRQENGQWCVYSADGSRSFGCYPTRGQAQERLDQMHRFGKEDSYKPPAGVRAAAQRALDWIAEGKAGSGFTDVGRARAAQLARGDAVSRETVGRMNSYFARHEVDRQATGFSAGEDGYPTPGRVAWDAWGGDPGRSWARRVADAMEKGEPGPGAVHVDTIMPSRRTRKDGEDGEYEPVLTDRQQVMYDLYEITVDAFGLFDQTDGADGAHYMPASGNPFAARGLACKNCVFYEGGGVCEIVAGRVEPEGVCKLWIIEEALLGEVNKRNALDGDVLPVSKSDGALRYTLGPMYVPDVIDAHGEWTDADELQQAVWGYVRDGDRRIRLQHNREVVAGEWVECMAWPWPVTVPMQQADGMVEMTYPANTVFLGVVWEPWAWELVKAGKLRGYSIGGTAERIMADMPDTTGADQ